MANAGAGFRKGIQTQLFGFAFLGGVDLAARGPCPHVGKPGLRDERRLVERGRAIRHHQQAAYPGLFHDHAPEDVEVAAHQPILVQGVHFPHFQQGRAGAGIVGL